MSPLGERARGGVWGRTVAYYLAGSLAAGWSLGALLGAVGSVVPAGALPRAEILVLLAVATALLDFGLFGIRLPTVRRQVDDQWPARYRSWVYGLGFGAQLGLGVVTVVETWAMYLVLSVELLSGSSAVGGLIGLTFGLTRALPILLVARVRTPNQLVSIDRYLQRTEPLSRRSSAFGLAAVSVAGAAMLLAHAAS